MLRNPQGISSYNKSWHWEDPKWADDIVKQVPLGIDPRKKENNGIFFMPSSHLMKDNQCIDTFHVGHFREDEGYTDTWYDAINSDFDPQVYFDSLNIFQYYFFTPSSNKGQMYFTVETYYNNIVP